jgi:type IV secretory pathway TraG/TraD family ATPase VirD4
MPDLSELRLEWDAFWSWYHARNSEKHLYNADWAKLHEIRKHLKQSPDTHSLLLGIGPYNLPVRYYPSAQKPQLGNVLDIGPSQCGKSTKETGQILDWQGSVVVNDIKDELRPRTAGWRNVICNGNVFTVNVTGDRGHRFDPMYGLEEEDELFACAIHLLYNPDEKNKYWTHRAARMATQLFLAARRIAEHPLIFAARVIRLGVNKTAAQLNSIDPALAHAFLEEDYTPVKDYESERRALSDAWSTLTASLYPILTERLLRSFTTSDFTAEDILFSEDPVTVYFCWPEEDLQALQPLIRFVWESLIRNFKRLCRLSPNRPRHKLLLSLDEAGVTGLSRLPEDLATLNGRGITVSLTAQDIEQFKSLYGESRAKSLLNNIVCKIVHSQASYDTIRYFQLLLDYTSGFASSNNRHGDTQSEGRSEREVPLLTVRQFQELDINEVVIFILGTPPIRARRLSPQAIATLDVRKAIAPPPLPMLPAGLKIPAFAQWSRRYLAPGMYRLPQFAMGYAIALPDR